LTTFEYATVRTRGLVSRIAERAAPVRRSLRAVAGRGWVRVRPVAMTVCGLACITAGLFTVSVLAGLIAAGVAFLLVDWAAK
jgi:hypothetical protein